MINARLQAALRSAPDWLSAHRRGLTVAIVTALTGFGITAFGIAPLAPDANDLPRSLVTEVVEPMDLQAQIEALADHDLTLWRSDVTRGADTAEGILRRLGVVDAQAAAFLRADPQARRILQGRGKLLQARTDSEGRLHELVARFPSETKELAGTHFQRLTVKRAQGQFISRTESAALSSQVRMASGTIQSSLFAATDEARLPDSVAVQLAEIFSTEIDFHRELRRGDTFSVVFEALYADGEAVSWNEGAGRVLAAEFVNKGRAFHAVWFAGAEGKGSYFALDGSSKRRTFLASPMAFSRVTSGFGARFHPLLQRWRQHQGVDYAAPIGTPVRTIGEGVVDFAGWQNGYGKTVIIRHGNNRTTLYAHLSTMNVRKGERVDQGQQIGAVGMTGWTTGPHLHFEFRVGGQHVDPLQVARASETVTLDAASRARFAELARAMQGHLDVAENFAGLRYTAE